MVQKPRRVDAKVICIGNLTAGGSGKTPYAIYLYHELSGQGGSGKFKKDEIAFISRGYRGSTSSGTSVHKVLPSDDYKMVGDEPLLLAEFASTYICKNRYLAAKQAVLDGAKIIIMDDGLQNNTIYKDESILIFDLLNGFGNGLLLPAGPMREPYCMRKKSVDKVIIIGDSIIDNPIAGNPIDNSFSDSNITSAREKFFKARAGKFILDHPKIINLEPKILNIDKILKLADTTGARKIRPNIVLLTAIANSNRVLHMLKKEGIDVHKHIALKDHSEFSAEILKDLQNLAKNNAILLTTQKDIVRIPKKYRNIFIVLEYALAKS